MAIIKLEPNIWYEDPQMFFKYTISLESPDYVDCIAIAKRDKRIYRTPLSITSINNNEDQFTLAKNPKTLETLYGTKS